MTNPQRIIDVESPLFKKVKTLGRSKSVIIYLFVSYFTILYSNQFKYSGAAVTKQ